MSLFILQLYCVFLALKSYVMPLIFTTVTFILQLSLTFGKSLLSELIFVRVEYNLFNTKKRLFCVPNRYKDTLESHGPVNPVCHRKHFPSHKLCSFK